MDDSPNLLNLLPAKLSHYTVSSIVSSLKAKIKSMEEVAMRQGDVSHFLQSNEMAISMCSSRINWTALLISKLN